MTNPVQYILAMTAWQLAALPVTVLLISSHFTQETQGFYYTFLSLIALQSFLELGLNTVLLNVVSHETARASLREQGHLAGDPRAASRIASLARFALRWYLTSAMIFLAFVGAGGWLFFSVSRPGDEWMLPWLALVAVSSLQFVVSPFNYLLEGLGQLHVIARMRCFGTVAHSLAAWTALAAGAGLWTLATSSGVLLLVNLCFLWLTYPEFFRGLLKMPDGESIAWRGEIWPMQWRLAIQGTVNYFFYSLFTPVLFHYHGAVEAGRLGMTLQMLSGLQSAALAWLQATVPQLGNLVARKRFADLNALWRRATLSVFVFSLVGYAAVVIAVSILERLAPSLAERVADLATIGILAAAYCLLQAVQCMAAYMRAFKREAMTWVSFTSGVLGGMLIWALGARYGALGAAIAFLTVTAVVALPWTTVVWLHARRAWPAASLDLKTT
jgi:O-antigen/teichoic acid export membrane protein